MKKYSITVARCAQHTTTCFYNALYVCSFIYFHIYSLVLFFIKNKSGWDQSWTFINVQCNVHFLFSWKSFILIFYSLHASLGHVGRSCPPSAKRDCIVFSHIKYLKWFMHFFGSIKKMQKDAKRCNLKTHCNIVITFAHKKTNV